MDVEVYCKNSIYAIPYKPVKHVHAVPSMLCIYGDLTYSQAWRGFIWAGPGKASLGANLKISSIFVAPFNEVSTSNESEILKTMINPCEINYTMEHKIHSIESKLPERLKALFAYNLLGPWAFKSSNFKSAKTIYGPLGAKTTSLKIHRKPLMIFRLLNFNLH